MLLKEKRTTAYTTPPVKLNSLELKDLELILAENPDVTISTVFRSLLRIEADSIREGRLKKLRSGGVS